MNNPTTRFRVLGQGAWGAGFQTIDQLLDLMGKEREVAFNAPKPEVLPAAERRRAPLSVRLAVESSWQAVTDSGYAPEDLPSVFVSGLGDTSLTDYMCTALSKENKALSPTKFHNSVHNAAAGYWTISTGCMRAANSVAAYHYSASLALLEALSQSAYENTPILITFYDAPVAEKLQPLLLNNFAFSYSMVVAPCTDNEEGESCAKDFRFESKVVSNRENWNLPANISPTLQPIFEVNPAAKILAFVQFLLASKLNDSIVFPLSSHTGLKISKV